MTVFGQLILLFAFVAAGYSAFACVLGWRFNHRLIQRSGYISAFASVGALSILLLILIQAFTHNDFRFSYVAQYSSSTLPWHYAISALWVGQAGSLLLWSWCLGVIALLYRFWPRKQLDPTRDVTFAVLLTYLLFLVVVMVFGADPMEPSLSTPTEGAGMSPSLQHPVMLIHPPVVFLGYAIWAVPFALALSALLTGQINRQWFEQARRWTLCAWTILGLGILLGAKWAYEELGWGGYWSWDPVENGSLIPWLTGTALIHCGLAWHYRGLLKKTTLVLSILTFALCNFAAFLTRSGIVGSLHEFSQSPIGWLFLGLMALLAVFAIVLVPMRRRALSADNRVASLGSREACVVIASIGWLGLTIVVFLGTLAVPLSGMVMQQQITIGPAFYNYALMPVGIVLLITTAAAPLLCWGTAAKSAERKALWMALSVAILIVIISAIFFGIRRPLALVVSGSVAFAISVFLLALLLDCRSTIRDCRNCRGHRRGTMHGMVAMVGENGTVLFAAFFSTFRIHRRRYAGFAIHLGFVAIAVAVTGSSLGVQRWETTMRRGETVSWAGRTIRFVELRQQRQTDKLEIEARLEINSPWHGSVTLLPTQSLYSLQNQWKSQVAIDSSLGSDFYVILNSGRGDDQIDVTFVKNPLMCWMWWGGALICAASMIALWPARAKKTINPSSSTTQRIEIHKPANIPPPRVVHAGRKNIIHDSYRR